MNTIKFDVFGRGVLVVGDGKSWEAIYVGAEGKRRRATDIVIPRGVEEDNLAEYLGDLCHEWAALQHNNVTRRD